MPDTTIEREAEEQITTVGSKPRKDFFSWVGYAAGAWGLFALIGEVSPVVIYGRLERWRDSYISLIEGVGGFLFGWIDLWWIHVHSIEMHMITLSLIVSLAVIRGIINFGIDKNVLRSAPPVLITYVKLRVFAQFGPIVLITSFLPAIALPVWLSILMYFAFVTWLALWAIGIPAAYWSTDAPLRGFVRQQILLTLGLFALLVFLNYTFFRLEAWG